MRQKHTLRDVNMKRKLDNAEFAGLKRMGILCVSEAQIYIYILAPLYE